MEHGREPAHALAKAAVEAGQAHALRVPGRTMPSTDRHFEPALPGTCLAMPAGMTPTTLHRGYAWKGFGLLLFIGSVAAAMFFGPALRQPPEPGPEVSLPAMTNVPAEGSLQIEAE
jgi:hypothetical protein